MAELAARDIAVLWGNMREGEAYRAFVVAMGAADRAGPTEIPYADGILMAKEKLLREAIVAEGFDAEDVAVVLGVFKEVARKGGGVEEIAGRWLLKRAIR